MTSNAQTLTDQLPAFIYYMGWIGVLLLVVIVVEFVTERIEKRRRRERRRAARRAAALDALDSSPYRLR